MRIRDRRENRAWSRTRLCSRRHRQLVKRYGESAFLRTACREPQMYAPVALPLRALLRARYGTISIVGDRVTFVTFSRRRNPIRLKAITSSAQIAPNRNLLIPRLPTSSPPCATRQRLPPCLAWSGLRVLGQCPAAPAQNARPPAFCA